MFNLKSPCPHCPFRTDIKPYLTHSRAASIARTLLADGTFHCHNTTVSEENDDGCDGRRVAPESQHCAGATIILEKELRPNQMMRIAQRMGMYDPGKLDMGAPVFDILEEWVESQEGD